VGLAGHTRLWRWDSPALCGAPLPLPRLHSHGQADQAQQSTRLSALSLHPAAIYWPLVDAARTLILTGFLTLVDPGSITQLLCGLVASFAFTVLQIWAAPYTLPSNNFVALVANAGIVLNFVSSLGVQVNSATGHNYVNNMLLEAGLFAAAFAVFVVTFCSFIAARSLRVKASTLQEMLLGLDVGSTSGRTLEVTPQMTIAWKDIFQVLTAPLLTETEVATLRSISLA
jgi:hypothetical protein